MANILAIDDEIPILELIKNGLQKDGHTVSTYPSVSQIPLEYLNRYDLIMLDIMMPMACIRRKSKVAQFMRSRFTRKINSHIVKNMLE